MVVRAWEQRPDRPGLLFVAAEILVCRPSQKGIIIGKGGKRLKEAGSAARRELEQALGRRLYLDLRVRVHPGWMRDPEVLREMGLFAR